MNEIAALVLKNFVEQFTMAVFVFIIMAAWIVSIQKIYNKTITDQAAVAKTVFDTITTLKKTIDKADENIHSIQQILLFLQRNVETNTGMMIKDKEDIGRAIESFKLSHEKKKYDNKIIKENLEKILESLENIAPLLARVDVRLTRCDAKCTR